MEFGLDEHMIARIAEMQAEDRAIFDKFILSEPLLERIASSDLLSPIAFSSDAKIVWNDGEHTSGNLSFNWSGPDVSATLVRTFVGSTEIPQPNRGFGKMEFDQGWESDAVHIDDSQISRQQSTAGSVTICTETLNARKLRNVQRPNAPELFHRVTYAGGTLNGFPHLGADRKAKSLQFNMLRTTLFGRKCVIKSAASSTHRIATTVCYEGKRLSASEQRSLWIFLSYITGPRLQIVSSEGFDESGLLVSLEIPNGSGGSGEASSPLITTAALGEPFAQQCPGLLDRLHADLIANFPWHVVFHHLHESFSLFPETAIKNLHIALDALIEAQVKLNEKARIVPKNEYKVVRDSLLVVLKAECDKIENGVELYEHLEKILLPANHRGTQQKRKMFWQEFEIDVTPFSEVLAFRDPALHEGHVLDYSAEIDYLEFIPKIHDLRTLVNRAILKRLGYVGPIRDYKTGQTVTV